MPVTVELSPEMMERAQHLAEEPDTNVSALVLEVFLAYLEEDQSWYWSKEWQAAEREAEADLAEGRYANFTSMDDFFGDRALDKTL